MRKELDGHAGFHINPTLSLSLDFLVSPQPGLFELLEVKQEAARPLSWLYAGCLQGHVELFRSVCTTTFSDLFEKGSQPTSAEFALRVLDSLPLRENLVDCVQRTQCRILVSCEGERLF